MITIRENAIFIADAHYPTHGDTLLQVLQDIKSGEIVTLQLFLMGDIFDLLIGGVEESILPNQEVISMIESISRDIEVYYFEGNHDFLLDRVFSGIQIYRREQQPQYMQLENRRVGLSHGDRFSVGWKHDLMSRILRKQWIVKLIKRLKPDIIEEKSAYLATKEICHEISHFETIANQIFDSYSDVDLVIEGHYHQAGEYGDYISLPSLACQGQVGVVRDGKVIFIDPFLRD